MTRPPAETNDLALSDHWQSELIHGKMNRSAIGTMVERSRRVVTLAHLHHDHTAETVRDGLVETVNELPLALRRSLTCDQGAEMLEHIAFRGATNMDTSGMRTTQTIG